MSGINPSDSVSPDDKRIYEKQFRESMQCFSEALGSYSKKGSSDDIYQKSKYKDVMDKMLSVMNELANVTLQKGAKEAEGKLSSDYQTFAQSGDEENLKKVQQDLQELKDNMKES